MRSLRIGGFTLIELLVVISIISLLIAILLPCLGRAREQSRRVACMADLRSVGHAIHMYANDYSGRLLAGDYGIAWAVWGPGTECAEASAGSQIVNLGRLMKHLLPLPEDKKDSAFFCPSSRSPNGGSPSEGFRKAWGQEGSVASITYMFNTALDGFSEQLVTGKQAVMSHKDVINDLLGDGSVKVFHQKPLEFEVGHKPELLQEVCERHQVCFPAALLHRWLENGDIDLTEAREFLSDPLDWVMKNSAQSEYKPVLLGQVGRRSLACDVVGVWDAETYNSIGTQTGHG